MLRYILKLLALVVSENFQTFCDGKIGDGSDVMNAICSRPEVAGDKISYEDLDNFK